MWAKTHYNSYISLYIFVPDLEFVQTKMVPHFNYQFQNHGANGPVSQQVFQPNPSSQQGFQSNPFSALQNPGQIQPQMGLMNPQTPISYSNSNTHINNGPSAITQSGYHHLPLQNNHLGMAQLGFNQQNGMHNMNPVAMFPVHGQFHNLGQNASQIVPSQPQGQVFQHSLANLPQQFNQNISLPNGQFCFPNSMPNMNQLVPMQISNPSQVFPYNVHPCSNNIFGCVNQVSQGIGHQNPNSFANAQFGLVHSNQVQQQLNQNQQMDANSLKPSPLANLQLQGNASTPLKSNPTHPQQGQKNSRHSAFTNSKGNWKNSPNKNFTRNPRGEASKFQKSQFRHVKNARRKSGFPNEHRGKGFRNGVSGKFGLDDSTNQATEKKRSLSLSYTEQEIQQWREERRKNYPSKPNVEKKLSEKLKDSKAIEREAILRREQLKEILTKQAELGVEVAEIPSYYMSDSRKQVHGREEVRKPLHKRTRFQNKHDKKGRCDKNDWVSKKQKFGNNDSCNVSSLNKRKPTLLQKLLGEDIRRDKCRLLQAFRFMVMNSFFKDWPEKPLEYPSVIVREGGCEGEIIEEKSLHIGKDDSEGSKKLVAENFVNDDDDGDNNDTDEDDGEEKGACYAFGKKNSIEEEGERPAEEEGEIID